MYLRIFFLLTFSMMWASAQAAKWDDHGHGHVHVNGQIQESACSIHTDDVWQEVTFPAFSSTSLENSGLTSQLPFSLRLVNCDLKRDRGGEWKSVSVTFDGDRVESHPELFAVTGNVQGFALTVSDESGHIAHPGEMMDEMPLNKEGTELRYRLAVVPTGDDFEEGIWSGTVRFMVTYQ
ncbi:fimbrial protein [Pantoea allii]|uniref:Type 1 fimbrial protein n=1 Tax=Pantoea allii TaxID=574096 RepID=A0ABS6VFJ9_9GAMM|nr:fimbrial protein [Pantoea allii]MBW1214081.1 type 1 fimbrial protein [Pantoea allii]MBW1253188.1 type 1 fimbrial protein [Pantoea allii]MBW1258080.1 type 1 fimbrial protein [Pantoea allii]MBW1262716.1 type 1 fimbrial protein [Pantoea allii]MBW1267092.1 type 1 fimbrial protein [Pantoea allii]